MRKHFNELILDSNILIKCVKQMKRVAENEGIQDFKAKYFDKIYLKVVKLKLDVK